MGKSNKDNKGPAPILAPIQSVYYSEQIARELQKRNALRRGIWNTLKNRQGFMGDTSQAVTAAKSLIGS